MSRIFHQRVSLLPDDRKGEHIHLFESKEELDFFQLRMGLDCLCQNTLFYPFYQDDQLTYCWTQSPHAQEFYYKDCLRYCHEGAECARIRILEKLTQYFCEEKPDEYLSSMEEYAHRKQGFEWDKIPYDDKRPEEHYIRYRCPYNENLIKFAFPIYVNGEAVAMIHAGQFTVGESIKVNTMWTHHFHTEREMDDFIKSQLLPIVLDFQNQARRNLNMRQNQMLEDLKNECIEKMEEEMAEFLFHMPERLQSGESKEELSSYFWKIVKDCIGSFLHEMGVSELLLFLSEEYSQSQKSQRIPGVRLFPEVQKVKTMEFDFSEIDHVPNAPHDHGNRRVPENVHYYTTIGTDDVPPPIVCFSSSYNLAPCDVLAYRE